MRRNNKQVTTYFILFSLLLIGVVYAILQANLQINGTAKIQANTWDIHFDNIQVSENSVSIGTGDSAATIDPENNCKVDFEVTLSIPGDFYEFTIDVINAGTIDGMIGTLNKTLKVNNEVVSEVPDYLDYSVTYEDGVEIEENHALNAGVTETYKVRLEFKTDIEELPQAATITTSLEPQYLQADTSAATVLHYKELYDVFKTEFITATNNRVQEYTRQHKDSFTVEGTKSIYYWYSYWNSPSDVIKNKWNVIFGGFCWQMYRTTDTGGVKLIYNGIPNNSVCDNSGVNQSIGKSPFSANYTSPAYVGYMYNPDKMIGNVGNSAPLENSLYGSDVYYDGTNYTLTGTSTTYDTTHHYSCNNTTGVCATVRYYYDGNYYTELNDGRNITQALQDTLSSDDVNQVNSVIKTYIDTWYQNNMASYTSKLEDTIFCNDRSVYNYSGWNPNGGALSNYLYFYNTLNSINLSCTNITDQFSLANSKAQLTYPVGLMTYDEAKLLNESELRKTGSTFWLATPNYFNKIYAESYEVSSGGGTSSNGVRTSFDVRPVVSVKPGTKYRYGDGSKNNPYIVE